MTGTRAQTALVVVLFLGSLSAFYLTAASSDERDAAAGVEPEERA